MSEPRSSLPKLLTESLLIVFSVLLALGVDEWRDGRKTQNRVDQALEGFSREVQSNRRAVANVLPYHQRLQRHYAGLTRTRLHSMPQMEGFQGFRPANLEDAAWRTALATGVFGDMDYRTASLLSRIYTSQENLRTNQSMIFSLLQPSSLTPQALPRTVDLLAGNLSDITLGERSLLDDYGALEKQLRAGGIEESDRVSAGQSGSLSP
jgi:hypothetical protein